MSNKISYFAQIQPNLTVRSCDYSFGSFPICKLEKSIDWFWTFGSRIKKLDRRKSFCSFGVAVPSQAWQLWVYCFWFNQTQCHCVFDMSSCWVYCFREPLHYRLRVSLGCWFKTEGHNFHLKIWRIRDQAMDKVPHRNATVLSSKKECAVLLISLSLLWMPLPMKSF